VAVAGNQAQLCLCLAGDAGDSRLRILKLLRFMPSLNIFWRLSSAPAIS
jgi:hypothetical protein